jgi:hypothetical protein
MTESPAASLFTGTPLFLFSFIKAHYLKPVLALYVLVHLRRRCHHVVVKMVHDPDGAHDHDEDDANGGNKYHKPPTRAGLVCQVHKEYELNKKLDDRKDQNGGYDRAVSHMKNFWIEHDKECGERKQHRKQESNDV